MKKYVFVKFRQTSHWVSCDSILKDLERSYLQLPHKISVVELDLDESTWAQDSLEVAKLEPDVVIFADHRIRIPMWIHLIKMHLLRDTAWVIHAYGCFTGRVDEWMQLSRLIPNDKVTFLSGTESHSRIIEQFFKNKTIVKTFPFPFLRKNDFLIATRELVREKYKIASSDIVFIYAGRISFQKNVHHLIKLMNNIPDGNFKLIVAGSPDDKNSREVPYAYYLNHASEVFQDAASRSKFEIIYQQHLPQAELYDLYCASDYVVSLSTLYGEDYGLSLVEGLSLGLGVIATAWGGHKSLKDLPQVNLVEVILEKETLKLNKDQFEEFLRTAHHQDKAYNVSAFEQKFNFIKSIKDLNKLLENFESLGEISRDALLFNLKANEPWTGKEFFNLHEKVLRPYWD